MLEIEKLKQSGHFQEFHLDTNEVLFDEGEKNQYIYIILAGELNVEKYTTNKRDETKILACLGKNEIFGEASLNSDKPKEVKMVATRKTLLLGIQVGDCLEKFTEKFPSDAMNLLKYIIHTSNKRLNNSNNLITANYKVTQEILKIEKVNNKNIFKLIDKLEEIIHIDYSLFLEKNTVLENYLVLKYDSRKKGMMQDEIIEVTDKKLHLLELKLQDTYHEIQSLNIGDDNLGYLVYFRKNKDFNDNDKKILTSISTGISGLIKEKKLLEEERDKSYMQD